MYQTIRWGNVEGVCCPHSAPRMMFALWLHFPPYFLVEGSALFCKDTAVPCLSGPYYFLSLSCFLPFLLSYWFHFTVLLPSSDALPAPHFCQFVCHTVIIHVSHVLCLIQIDNRSGLSTFTLVLRIYCYARSSIRYGPNPALVGLISPV